MELDFIHRQLLEERQMSGRPAKNADEAKRLEELVTEGYLEKVLIPHPSGKAFGITYRLIKK